MIIHCCIENWEKTLIRSIVEMKGNGYIWVSKWLLSDFKHNKRFPVLETEFTSCCGCGLKISLEKCEKNYDDLMILQISCQNNGVCYSTLKLRDQVTNNKNKKTRESTWTIKPSSYQNSDQHALLFKMCLINCEL